MKPLDTRCGAGQARRTRTTDTTEETRLAKVKVAMVITTTEL